jgi:hypothetical protein
MSSDRRGWRRNHRRGTALSGLRRGFLCGAFGFCGSFRVSGTLQMTLYLLGDVGGNRARVRLLFGNTKAWQEVNDGFRLDLELARQLVNANLIRVAHAS